MQFKCKELDQAYIMGTYGRNDVVIDHGKNATLWSDDGKKYIDFASGIGVLSVGTADEGYIEAVNNQLKKVQHMSNYFYSEPTAKLAEKIVKASGLKKVFFANSGAEANEGAIKLARKYSFDKYGANRNTIITFNKSFHGRTVTTLSATGQDVFHNFFFPFTEGFKYCKYNNSEEFLSSLTDDVCAVMFEVVQGEGGVNILDDDFAKLINSECKKRDILIIVDEVQTGIGRTGKMFGFMNYDLNPDIVTLAKGLAGGMPIGAFVAGDKCESVLGKGTHGSTFGGNPVSAAAGNYVFDKINNDEFMSDVIHKGEIIIKEISALNSPKINNIRGKGLMIGIEVTEDPHALTNKMLEQGLIALTAGTNVVRLLPPLTINEDELNDGICILKKVLSN